MTQGPTPGEWQGDPAGQQQAFGEQPTYPAQAWSASPGYGQPGFAATGYAMPGYGASPYGQPPPTYLTWARVAAVGGALFNLILGLPSAMVALRYAGRVRQHWDSGDQQAAFAASRMARIWAIVSTVFDALGVVLLIVLVTQISSSNSNFNNPAVVAASIKRQLQERLSNPSSQFYSPGLKVTSVVCTPAGNSTDRCVDHFSNGQTVAEIAVISANGERYLTHRP